MLDAIADIEFCEHCQGLLKDAGLGRTQRERTDAEDNQGELIVNYRDKDSE